MEAPPKVLVTAPATSANLGPGMDALGIALALTNTFEFEQAESRFIATATGVRADDVPVGANNLAIVGFQATREALGLPMARGLRVRIDVEVPPCGGLGSSATALVAGILAADVMAGEQLGREGRRRLATKLEGHPDNVVPCLEGGLCVALTGPGGELTVLRANPSNAPRLVALIPGELTLSTEEMRRVLPAQVQWRDAVHTAGCAAMLVFALLSGEHEALRVALDDRLHQPYRGPRIPGFDLVRAAAKEAGALGTVISGSGPTLLAFAGDDQIAAAVGQAATSVWADLGVAAEARVLDVDADGAQAVIV